MPIYKLSITFPRYIVHPYLATTQSIPFPYHHEGPQKSSLNDSSSHVEEVFCQKCPQNKQIGRAPEKAPVLRKIREAACCGSWCTSDGQNEVPLEKFCRNNHLVLPFTCYKKGIPTSYWWNWPRSFSISKANHHLDFNADGRTEWSVLQADPYLIFAILLLLKTVSHRTWVGRIFLLILA